MWCKYTGSFWNFQAQKSILVSKHTQVLVDLINTPFVRKDWTRLSISLLVATRLRFKWIWIQMAHLPNLACANSGLFVFDFSGIYADNAPFLDHVIHHFKGTIAQKSCLILYWLYQMSWSHQYPSVRPSHTFELFSTTYQELESLH